MNQTLQNKSKTYSKPPVTKVRLPWERGRIGWNEVCMWCVEQYGLPGDNFEWHPHSDHMEFDFYDEKDAIHFMLRWS